MSREELKAKYGDEEVLVVPLDVVKRLGLDDEGYLKFPEWEIEQKIAVMLEKAYFIPRYLSDDNPEEVELIPYVTISDWERESYFTYKRTKNGDSRGDGKLSIGVGGHINPSDGLMDTIIQENVIREVEEEIGVPMIKKMMEYKGFIRCKDSAFDLDHLGIEVNVVGQFIFDVTEKDKMFALGMITKKALKDITSLYDSLENWSKIIIDQGGK